MTPFSLRATAVSATVRQALLMGLLVLAMLLRGVIPAGYMPGSSQDSQGFFALEICTVDNAVKTVMLNLSGHDASPADTDDARTGQACVFAGLGAPVVLGVLYVLLVLVPFDPVRAAFTSYTSPSLPFFAGFPLGSRAPPVV